MGAEKTAPPRLRLLSRGYCHLCDLMREAVLAHPAAASLALDIVDVDADPALEARFDEQVPVLMHGERVICWGRFDAAAFAAWLQTCEPPAGTAAAVRGA